MNICTHYGFGDYVICYGLIRELAKRNDDINLFAIPHRSKLHIDNIKRLYSSIPNVTIITEDPKSYNDVIYIGWDKYNEAIKNDPTINCVEYFYWQVGVSLNLMWDNFYFERDIEKERAIYYDYFRLKDKDEYIFLHDDPIRNFVINKKYIKPDIKVIHLIEYEDISILDTLFLIEKCTEFHVFNTGLMPFVDLMGINHSSLNYHKYIRPLKSDQPILRLNWNIIT